jgi:hypothetical protein
VIFDVISLRKIWNDNWNVDIVPFVIHNNRYGSIGTTLRTIDNIPPVGYTVLDWRGIFMTKKTKIKVDDFELRLIVRALVEWKNSLQAENKPTEDIDDILLKIIK